MKNGLIIIPAHNEEENIQTVLEDLLKQDFELDILVVNDGSTDGTRARVERTPGVQMISHIFNLGYGAALQTGFQYAVRNGYTFVVQFDADGQHDPAYIHALLAAGDADIIIGSRFLQKSEYQADGLKMIAIRMMRLMIRFLTGVSITDPTSGFKRLSQRTLQYYAVTSNFPADYPDANLLIKMLHKKYRVKEVPVNIRPRLHGETMHSGLKPVAYVINIFISIAVVLLREYFREEK